MSGGIQRRGPGQYRVRIRISGELVTRTFDTEAQAREWRDIQRGKIIGEEFVDKKAAKATTVAEACLWCMNRIAPIGNDGKRNPRSSWAKNQLSHLKTWIENDTIASWSLLSVQPWDLIEIVSELLETRSAQTVVHRLNTLSVVYKDWSMAFRTPLHNPVSEGVRPSIGRGRDRRLVGPEEDELLKAAENSSRPWLRAAIVIAIETGMRQAELSNLTWDRVRLESEHPHVYLDRTKNGRSRTVPLSERAIDSFQALKALRSDEAAKTVFPVHTPRAVGHAFRDIVDGKFDNLRWHDLRHEAISRLFELTDLRDQEIQAIVGHLGAEMLSRYTHLRSARLGSRLPKFRPKNSH